MHDNLLIAIGTAISNTPQLRIGQLIANAAKAGGWEDTDVFYCPDEVILDGLNKLAATNRNIES